MSPKTSAPTKPIWNAHTTSSRPAPKSTNSDAAAVAIHGPTPARRMTTRSNAAAVKWSSTMSAWYGM